MRGMAKTASIITAMALGIMIGSAVQAETVEKLQAVLVYLQKARMTPAVQVKTRNLNRAKEQLEAIDYDRGGQRAAALTLTVQALGSVNGFKLDEANRQIDMAIVKVKHAIQAIKQEKASRKRQGAS